MANTSAPCGRPGRESTAEGERERERERERECVCVCSRVRITLVAILPLILPPTWRSHFRHVASAMSHSKMSLVTLTFPVVSTSLNPPWNRILVFCWYWWSTAAWPYLFCGENVSESSTIPFLSISP